jgi:resuscitation-promoting factor RpfA
MSAPPAPSATSHSRADRVVRVRVTSFPRRAAAALFDLGLLLALTAAVTTTVALALGVPMPGLREVGPDLLVAGILDRNPMAVGAVGLFLGMTGLYQLYFGGMSGQTPGMRLLGIRLISSRGGAPGPARGFLRLLALVPSLLPAGLGWLWALFDREHRALHDHLAGSYVIIDEG